jgi:hypothetical protein
MLERGRGNLGRLLFIGTGPTDYLDVLVREGWEDKVCEARARALRQMDLWRVAALQQVRPDAAAWGIFGQWNGLRTQVWQEGCPVIDVKPWDDLLMSLNKNHRSTFRKALRRAEADGIRSSVVDADGAEEAARKFVAVSREQWRDHPLTGPEYWTQRFEAHLETTAQRMTACGWGKTSELRRNAEVVISTLMNFGREFVGTYMIGASQEARQRYRWSSLYISDAANIARSRGSSHLDLLRGIEPYKLRWNSREVQNHRLIWGRGPLLWGAYAGYHAVRSKAKQYARSENAPPWAKHAASRYSALRNKGVRYVKQDRRQ